jgi:hypothetical protein
MSISNQPVNSNNNTTKIIDEVYNHQIIKDDRYSIRDVINFYATQKVLPQGKFSVLLFDNGSDYSYHSQHTRSRNEKRILQYLTENDSDKENNIIDYYNLKKGDIKAILDYFNSKINKNNEYNYYINLIKNPENLLTYEFSNTKLNDYNRIYAEYYDYTILDNKNVTNNNKRSLNKLKNSETTKNPIYYFLYDIKRQILNGLIYLFEKRVVHFDIRLENISVMEYDNKRFPTYKIFNFEYANQYRFEEKENSILPSMAITNPYCNEGNKMFYTTYGRDVYCFYSCMSEIKKALKSDDEIIDYDIFKRFNKKTTHAKTAEQINDITEDEYKLFYDELKKTLETADNKNIPIQNLERISNKIKSKKKGLDEKKARHEGKITTKIAKFFTRKTQKKNNLTFDEYLRDYLSFTGHVITDKEMKEHKKNYKELIKSRRTNKN